MSIQNPTASDLAAFVHSQDQKNNDLAARARVISTLPQSDPAWVRDWNAFMTRYAQAREVASRAIASAAGSSLDDVPADREYEMLSRAVRPYEAAQSTGDFEDLSHRLARAEGAPRPTGGRLSWSQIRGKLNAAGTVPALPIIEQGGDDVIRALQGFQAFVGLPSTGKLTGQTLAYLSAHGEAEKRPDVWRARFGADISGKTDRSVIADIARYASAGAVFGLIAKTLGASLLGTAAAATGGVALAAWIVANPRKLERAA